MFSNRISVIVFNRCNHFMKKLFLLPFAFIYAFVVYLRNKLYDFKILPSHSFSVPIISVGNISSGGTGKTPHTEYLIRLLCQTCKVSTLSRGYGRKTNGFLLADDSPSPKPAIKS